MRLPVAFGVAGHVAGLDRRRRLVAQHLFDRPGDQRVVLDEFTPLMGVFGQHLADESDQPGRRLVARSRDHAGVGEHLDAGQRPKLPVLFDFRVEQLRHQIVGRMVGAPLDVVGEQLIGVLEQLAVTA